MFDILKKTALVLVLTLVACGVQPSAKKQPITTSIVRSVSPYMGTNTPWCIGREKTPPITWYKQWGTIVVRTDESGRISSIRRVSGYSAYNDPIGAAHGKEGASGEFLAHQYRQKPIPQGKLEDGWVSVLTYTGSTWRFLVGSHKFQLVMDGAVFEGELACASDRTVAEEAWTNYIATQN